MPLACNCALCYCLSSLPDLGLQLVFFPFLAISSLVNVYRYETRHIKSQKLVLLYGQLGD